MRKPFQWLAKLTALAAGGFTAAGCGQPGPPLPPSANLPQIVSDLHAERLGPEIELHWTAPAKTSDGTRLRGAVGVRLCVWPGAVSYAAAPPPPAPLPETLPPPPAATPWSAPPVAPAPSTPERVAVCPDARVLLAPSATPAAAAAVPLAGLAPAATDASIHLAIGLTNQRGAMAGWSNIVAVATEPVAPPPADVAAVDTAKGVLLRWQPAAGAAAVRIYRQPAAGGPTSAVAAVPAEESSYLDATAPIGQRFAYWLRSLSSSGPEAVQSADSAHVTVTTSAAFAPPVPEGVEALLAPGATGVDLTWEPVEAPGLAGYNVYRRVDDSNWEKRTTSLLPTPVFHDDVAGVAPGTGLQYAITAVGDNGLESDRSAPASIRLPAPASR